MIPIRVLFAAFATLVIILDKMSSLYEKEKTSKIYDAIVNAGYAAAAYFWVASLFGFNNKTIVIIISSFSAFITIIFRLANKEKEEEKNAINNLIGQEGKVKGHFADGQGSYLGILDKSGNSIVIHCDTEMRAEDRFKISSIEGTKIISEKI